jgi:hypothetical protein
VTGGDIDADGDLDLAVASSAAVSILRNDGRRRFAHEGVTVPGFSISDVALGDLDGQAGLEMAAAGRFTLSVLCRAEGEGYGEVLRLIMGSNPVAVLTGDVDGNGDLDLVTGNSLGNVSVLINGGRGTFAPAKNYFAGEHLTSLTAGDLDGDGHLDLMALLSRPQDEVLALFNTGAGAFLETSGCRSLVHGGTLLARDFDRDGDLDLAHARGQLAFLPNHGERRIGPALSIPFAAEASSAVAADFDRDGLQDLAVTPEETSGIISIYKEVRLPYRSDCNHDSVPDDCQLAENDCNGNSLPDECDLELERSRDCDADRTPDECEPDCNRNGVADDCDLAGRTSEDCNANHIPDECDLDPLVQFLPPRTVATEIGLGAPHVGDLDQDGDQDLVAMTGERDVGHVAKRTNIIALLNDGSGGFEKAREQPVERADWIRLLADLDGDGDPDLLVDAGEEQTAFLNEGQAVFTAGPAFEGPYLARSAAADVMGDGGLEIALAARTGEVTFHRLRNGAFEHRDGFSAGGEVHSLASGDFDADGDVDLTAFLESWVRVFLNAAGSGFPLARDSAAGGADSQFTAADLDGDGALDLVESGLSQIELLMNRGDGSFERGASHPFEWRWPPRRVPAADLDGDRDNDLVVWGSATVLVNDGAAGFDSSFSVFNLYTLGSFVVAEAAEMDGDGLLDLVTLSDRGCFGPCFGEIWLRPNRTVRAASDDANHNRFPDECEGRPFRRGDFGDDGRVDLADVVALLLHLFHAGPAAGCSAAADATADGRIDIADPLFLCRWLFAGGPEPAPPSPSLGCGHAPDPAGVPAGLACASYDSC